MTRYQYKAARTKRGSLTYVARKLGIARSTLVRRESGRVKITLEAILAMRALPVAGFDAPMTAGQVRRRMTAGPRKAGRSMTAGHKGLVDLPFAVDDDPALEYSAFGGETP